MNRFLSLCLAASALVAIPTAASSTTLLDVTNIPNQSNTPTSFTFTAGSASTQLAIGGYNVPSFIDLTAIEVTLTGGSTNLLGTTWTFTPGAPACTDASQPGPGTFGTNNLHLGDVCVGDYDVFSQSFATTIGGSYTLSFLLSDNSSPNGLRITASDAQVGGVPEPAAWAMMLLGFAGIGLTMRRRVRAASAFA